MPRTHNKPIIMQRLLILLVTGLLTLPAFGEVTLWDTSKPEKQISVVPQIGLNLNHFTGDAAERWGDTKIGVNAGVMFDFRFIQSLSVKYGLFYSLKGSKGNNNEGIGNVETTFNPSYLEIPVLASYNLGLNDKWEVSFDLGFYYAIGISGKNEIKFKGSSAGVGSSSTKDDLFPDKFKRTDWGLRFGPSVTFLQKYQMGLMLDYGLANISKIGGDIGTFSFMINFGYKFNFKN